MRRGGLALIAILVVGGLTKLLVPQSQPAPAAGQTRTATTTKAATQQEPPDLEKAQNSVEWYPSQLREKIRDFFGVEYGPDLDKPKGNVAQVCVSLKNWCVPPALRSGIQFVIATVPDPVHTHLGLVFDRSIDAIQQGATSQGYLFDRAIMPWQYFVPQNTEETDEDRLIRRVRESYPGLMIFRGGPNICTLFVFVVGEAPTAGINKEQFHRAVEMIHQIREGSDHVDPGVALDFAVLGPSFSGSLYSLREALREYTHELPADPKSGTREIPVYSTAMDADAIQYLAKEGPPQARLAIFQQDGSSELHALLKFTGNLGYDNSTIAVLNEDDTAYGMPGATSPAKESDSYVNLAFPRGISQFRSAYSKDLQTQEQTTDPNQPQRRNLRLDLEVTGGDDDNVAPYTPAQTALSQESIMLEIVRELDHFHAKFILIRATDHLDELFLARYLSSQFPDARLVVPTPDLLFAREEGGDVDGTLGLNTYPVSPGYLNELCPSARDVRGLSFPTSASVALYNSTVALLGEVSRTAGGPPEAENTDKSPDPNFLEVNTQPCSLSPNLWLTIVSRNTFQPIQVLGSSGSLAFPKSGEAGFRPEEHLIIDRKIDMLWLIVWVLTLLLLANHLLALLKPNPLGYWGTVKTQGDPQNSRDRRNRILWVGAATLAGILIVFICSCAPFTHVYRSILLTCITTVSGLGLTILVVAVTLDYWKGRNERVLAASFLGLSVCFAVAGLAFAYAKSSEMVLWEQRTVDLKSQVSPATPFLLLLAAFYVWFWYSLRAESLIDWRTPHLPDPDGLPTTDFGLTEAVAETIRKVIPSFAPTRWVHGWTLLIIALIALRGYLEGSNHIPIRSLEGVSYDWIYSLLFAVALYLLVGTLLRLVAVWRSLRVLLSALNRPGMREALERLKGFGWNEMWNPLESMQDETTKLYRKCIQVVERLQDGLGNPRDAAQPDPFNTIRTNCKNIVDRWGRIVQLVENDPKSANPGDLMVAVQELQGEMANAAKTLLKDFLETSWKSLPADNGEASSPEKEESSPGTTTINAKIQNPDESVRAIISAEITGEDSSKSSNQAGLSAKSKQLAEELVACVYATFIAFVLLRIRWLLWSSGIIYLAIVFSSASYPFQPASSLRTLALLLFLFGTFIVGYVYEKMSHNVTLRKMTSPEPDKSDSGLWLKVASAAVLPLLGLLTTVFPSIGHLLYTIAAPILQATR
jgi:hypothetical protein